MLFCVSAYFKKEKAALSAKVPILNEVIDDFETTTKQIQKLINDTNRKTKSVTRYKTAYKGILIEAVLKLSKAGRAYCVRSKDAELRKKLVCTKTQLMRPQPGIVAERCKEIIDAAKALRRYINMVSSPSIYSSLKRTSTSSPISCMPRRNTGPS